MTQLTALLALTADRFRPRARRPATSALPNGKDMHMMRRLLRRAVLLLSVLSILVVPTGTSSAQEPLHDGEFEGIVLASNVAAPCPDPMNPGLHGRCEGNFLNATIDVAARRPGPGPRAELECVSSVGANVPFRARQDLAQGRGFVGPAAAAVEGSGALVTDTTVEDVNCRILVTGGVFHRVGTAAYGRLLVTIQARRVDTNALVFDHSYCGRFTASAVPTAVGPTLVTAEADGRVDCNDPGDDVHDVGRTPDDDTDTHG